MPDGPLPFAGLTALVTGGSRNLGAAIAHALAANGASVLITYRHDAAAADSVRVALPTPAEQPHLAWPAELEHGPGQEAFGDRVASELGGVDIIVNNAGPFEMTPLTELTTDRFDEIWQANLGTVRTLAARLGPMMRGRGWGRIINLSAGSAYVRNHSVYTLAKAAVEILTEQLAIELAPEVTVNAVAPGQIAESADEIGEIDPSFVDRAIASTPLGRLATRTEVAELVTTLCLPSFDSVTGAVIPIDGGWRLPRF